MLKFNILSQILIDHSPIGNGSENSEGLVTTKQVLSLLKVILIDDKTASNSQSCDDEDEKTQVSLES